MIVIGRINFNPEIRSFSTFVDKLTNSRTYKGFQTNKWKVGSHASNIMGDSRGFLSRNKNTIATVGVGALGGVVGGVAAKMKAKKDALAKGLEPGTKEYKNYIRNRTIGGAALGAGLGAGAGYLGRNQISNLAKSKFDGIHKKLRVANMGSSRTDRDRELARSARDSIKASNRLYEKLKNNG